MREELIKFVVCPDCRGKLKIIKSRKIERIKDGERIEEIWDGILKCTKCGRYFPVVRGVLWIYPKNFVRIDIIGKISKVLTE